MTDIGAILIAPMFVSSLGEVEVHHMGPQLQSFLLRIPQVLRFSWVLTRVRLPPHKWFPWWLFALVYSHLAFGGWGNQQFAPVSHTCYRAGLIFDQFFPDVSGGFSPHSSFCQSSEVLCLLGENFFLCGTQVFCGLWSWCWLCIR